MNTWLRKLSVLALVTLACAGCNNLLGIEDLSTGGDTPDASVNVPDASTPTPDAMNPPDASNPGDLLTFGFPERFEEITTLVEGRLWGMDIDVNAPIRPVQLGIILAKQKAEAQLGLYYFEKDMRLIGQTRVSSLTTGVNEIEIEDVGEEIEPGSYIIAVAFDRDVQVHSGGEARLLHPIGHNFGDQLPDQFFIMGPVQESPARNLYVIGEQL